MSYKETCPGCGSHTTEVAHARANDEPCPRCGLSSAAATEIMTVRRGQADDAVKAEFADLRKRADRAERDNQVLGNILGQIYEALREWEQFAEHQAEHESRDR